MDTHTLVEQRNNYRIPMGSTIVFRELVVSEEAPKKYFAQMVDVSTGGVLMVTEESFPLGSLLQLEMHIGRWEKYSNKFIRFDQFSISKPLVAVGLISRIHHIEDTERFYIGITFKNIDYDEWKAFGRYVLSRKKNN